MTKLTTAALSAMMSLVGLAPAFAADLPARSEPAPYIAPPVFTWTGFYAGVNAGGIFGSGGSFTDPTYGSVTGTSGSSAFSGGGQIGYNYQFTPGSGFVVGVETDIQGVVGGDNRTWAIGTTPYYNVSPGLDYYATVRGRIGYAFDRILVYGTGGFAYGGGSTPSLATSYPYTLPETTRTGFAVGGGVEYAFMPHVGAKIEGLYVKLDRGNAGATYYDTPTSAYYGADRRDDGFGVVRAGLNYRF